MNDAIDAIDIPPAPADAVPERAAKPKPRRRKPPKPAKPARPDDGQPDDDGPAFPDALGNLTPGRVVASIVAYRRVAVPVSVIADDLRVTSADVLPILDGLEADGRVFAWSWHDEEAYRKAETLRSAAHDAMLAADEERYLQAGVVIGQQLREADEAGEPISDEDLAAMIAGVRLPRTDEYVPREPVYVAVVTLTDDEAARQRLRKNSSGRRWMGIGAEELPDRLSPGAAVRETDLKVDPPGKLDSYPARDPNSSVALRAADEEAGYIWPTTILTGIRPWPLPGQSKGDHQHRTKVWRPVDPRGPQPNPRGLPSERGRRGRDAADDAAERRWIAANPLERGRDGGVVCAGCGGRELWDGMLGRERVSGGEFCAACEKTARDQD